MARETVPSPRVTECLGQGLLAMISPSKASAPGPSWGAVGHSWQVRDKGHRERVCVGERNLSFTRIPWGLSWPPPLPSPHTRTLTPSGQSARAVSSLRTGKGWVEPGWVLSLFFGPIHYFLSFFHCPKRQTGEMASLSPAAGPGYRRGPQGRPGQVEGRSASSVVERVTLSMPKPPGCQTPDEG